MSRLVPWLLPLALAAGCGTTNPPAELVSARAAYNAAAKGPAAQYSPADLHTAKSSLERAEAEYKDTGDSDDTKALGYIAERKALQADSIGRAAEVHHEKVAAEEERRVLQSKLTKSAEERAKLAAAEAKKAEEAAKAAKTDLEKEKTLAFSQQKKLEAEKAAREAAEASAKDAAAALAKLKAKEEARGLVITLSGSVLFAFGTSELLPTARNKLDEVAEALKEVPERMFIVEGHTDSVGSDDANQALSQKRADVVRAHLVTRGVDAARIRAVGKGENMPIASNASPEGRANNRRVEIVVQPSGIGGGPAKESSPYE